MQKAYRESMRMVHPSGQFLSRLEAEMRRGLQKRRGLSPRRLLLPAAAVAAAFLLVLTLVAQQARRAGAPVSAFQPLSAATPGEVQTANAGEIRAASPSEVRGANAGENRNAAAGEIRAASPSEVRNASAGEIRNATSGEIRAASPSEVRNASTGEIRNATSGEIRAASPSEVRGANAGENRNAAAGEIRAASPSEVRNASTGEIRNATSGEIRAASPSEVRGANAGENRNAAAGEIRAASPSEVRNASTGEIRNATSGEIRTASPSEVRGENAGETRNASAGEIQTASAGELSIATPSEGEPRRNTAMSEDEARARVLEVDRDAATAEHIFTFPCAESDGAFVVVRQTLDDATWTTNGRVWYVTQTNAWLLAQKDVIWSWTHDPDSFSPEVFSICHGKDRDRSALAWIVLDGRPVEVKNAPSIYGVEPTRGALIGQVAFQNYDYAFLGVDASDPENVQFYQIEGVELTREQFLTFPGAQEVLDLVEGDGTFSIYQILYWQDSAMALNFMQGDLERTTYLYFVDGKLQCQGGWFGDDIGLASGRATTFRNLPIPVRHTQLNP